MTAPPRPKPRAVAPAQPYPPATDLEVPIDAEPFPLTSPDVPTMRDLSEQIGAVSSHLQVVHQEAALARAAAVDAARAAQQAQQAANAAAARVDLARSEIAEVRGLVVGDHAPRITETERAVKEVEKRAPVKTWGKYSAIALAIPAALQVLAALKPDLAGPIQLIEQLFR